MVLRLKIFLSLFSLGKCLSTRVRKSVVVSAFLECFLVRGGGGGVAWSNDALSDERDDSHLLMPAGMFFVVIGGWLLSRWTYCSVVVGAVVKVKGDV